MESKQKGGKDIYGEQEEESTVEGWPWSCLDNGGRGAGEVITRAAHNDGVLRAINANS